jgi:hypothetical protein
VPQHEFGEEGLVLHVVFGDFRVRSLVLVGGEIGRCRGYFEGDAANAAELVVFGVDGEGEMPMDSVSSRGVDRRGVGIELYMGGEDGDEGGFRVRVTDSCEHRVWQVERESVAR